MTSSFPLGLSSTQDGTHFITILESGLLAGLGLSLALGPLILISVFFCLKAKLFPKPQFRGVNYGGVLCPGSSEIFEDLNQALGQPVEVKIPLLLIEPACSTLKERAWQLTVALASWSFVSGERCQGAVNCT